CRHDGVALFSGSATIPEMRRRGLQSALLAERMRYAFDHGRDMAMMVAEAGSNSQRNAERKGFKTAYARHKMALIFLKGRRIYVSIGELPPQAAGKDV
ncbi:MAG: hypothetical protein M3N54_02910, partial [Acidobacteriota bacterium]|nr:hypothetical protein [Acidobacteriota bacterium]